MELPVITVVNLRKVKEFYKQLRYNVQSLDTLERLGDVKGNVRSTLDKLKGVKADLVRGNEGWRDCVFKEDLLREFKKWTDVNPVEESMAERSLVKSKANNAHAFTENHFTARNTNRKPAICLLQRSKSSISQLHKGHRDGGEA